MRGEKFLNVKKPICALMVGKAPNFKRGLTKKKKSARAPKTFGWEKYGARVKYDPWMGGAKRGRAGFLGGKTLKTLKS